MKIKFNIPTNWNLLKDKQLLQIAKLFFLTQQTVVFDYRLFKILTNYKWYKFLLLRKISILFKEVPINEIKSNFDFIYKKQDLTRFINSVEIGEETFYAPADRLTNLSIGEFSVCEDLYLGYLRNCKSKKNNYGYSYLVYLFAILYISLPSAKRPKFQKDDLENLVAAIENVNKKYVLACLLSYKGCRDAISSSKKYKHIFPSKKTEPKTVLKIPASSGFSDVLLSFSGKMFGDYDKTFTTNLYTFLDGYEIALKTIPKDATNI